ncbi:MAG: Ppx/GppA family phosphatase [Clostridiaceae bacterium]|jgi:exopolyphosphatase/guanosine-5'-triphosphate,3'-diphosphate pyrophosphatase|nr:Ppx/GppA family phosphatase [Clostridiaceae bacterium]
MEKIAIIDLGSNSARLVLVNIMEGGYFVVFDELKETVRLGQDMELDGFLKPPRIAQTIKTLKMFKRLCDANGISKIFAYATSAVRRAKNQKSFLDEVAANCGIKIKVLTKEEQATLVYQGAINSLDVPKGFIMDIGGGSTQFIYYNRRNLINYETLPFGSITLTDLFKNDSDDPTVRAEKIEAFITENLQKISWLPQVEPDTQFVGVGGTFRNLGRISKMYRRYPFDMSHNYVVPEDEFKTGIYDTIKTYDLDKTMKIKGLSSGRADIFPSALAAINSVFNYMKFDKVIISGCGLREGAMFRYAVPTTVEKPLSDVLGHSIMTLMNYFDINVQHAEHVYYLSMQLYKQLKVLHKLPRACVKVLRVASLLHDSGMRIKYYDHQYHSSYIILNSNLYGISHKDLVMAAFVAAGHRKASFSSGDLLRYREMFTPEDIDAIKKLSVILRIAESFDRSMCGLITGLNCDVLGDSVIMKTETEGDCSLEIKDALTCASDFRRSYGKNLEIL